LTHEILITIAKHLIYCQQLFIHHLQLIGDAEEFFLSVKQALQNEVSSFHKKHGNNTNNYYSFIVNFLAMFNGCQVESSVICTKCNQSTVSLEDLHSLRLGFDPAHGNKKFSLGDMLRYCSTNGGEHVQRFCATCREETIMTQQSRFDNFPPILCIQLERGQYVKTTRNQSSVDFPLDNFQPHQYFGPNNESVDSKEYYLFAVVIHNGRKNSEGGHYTAVCRQDVGGIWWKYDDDQVQLAQFTQRNKENGTVMASFQKTATMLFYRQYDKPQTPAQEVIVLTGDDDDDDDASRFSDHEIYDNSKSNVDGEANSGTGNTDTNDTSNESRFSCILTSNKNDSDDESLFPSPENDEISNSNVENEANNGTDKTYTANDTSHINQDVEAVENVETSNDSTIQEVSTSIIFVQRSKNMIHFFLFYFTLQFSVIVN
jgi:hypothetical protein